MHQRYSRTGRLQPGERIADGYRRIPQDQPDEWGAALVSADIATAELVVRLDAEDRAAGHHGW